MRLEAHHIPDSPAPDPRGEAAPADTAPAQAAPAQAAPDSPAPGAAGPQTEPPLNSASPTRDHSTTRPRDHASPPDHAAPLSPQSSVLSTFPSPLPPADLHALETYLFTHNRNLIAAAAALGCQAITLALFLRQPHIAPIVDELTTAEERRELLPLIEQLKSDVFACDNPAERRRTAAVVINFYTRGIRPQRATGSAAEPVASRSTSPASRANPTDPETPPRGSGAPTVHQGSASESRAAALTGSAGAAVSTSSTSSRPTNTAAPHPSPTTTSSNAPTAKQGSAAPHQSAHPATTGADSTEATSATDARELKRAEADRADPNHADRRRQRRSNPGPTADRASTSSPTRAVAVGAQDAPTPDASTAPRDRLEHPPPAAHNPIDDTAAPESSAAAAPAPSPATAPAPTGPIDPADPPFDPLDQIVNSFEPDTLPHNFAALLASRDTDTLARLITRARAATLTITDARGERTPPTRLSHHDLPEALRKFCFDSAVTCTTKQTERFSDTAAWAITTRGPRGYTSITLHMVRSFKPGEVPWQLTRLTAHGGPGFSDPPRDPPALTARPPPQLLTTRYA